MMKSKLLMIVNPLLFVSIMIQFITGILMDEFHFKLAHDLHVTNVFALEALFVCHIILNWSWIKTNLLRIKK